VTDQLDLDSDNDGLTDILESQGPEADLDGDGQVDDLIDNNGDGLADVLALLPVVVGDNDADGIPDYLDLDSDNDGVLDIVEAGAEDIDNDGMVDALMDTDADGVPDDIDVDFTGGADADNDGIDDIADADFATGADTDSDGIIDFFDDDADGNGIIDSLEDGLVLGAALPDIDNNNIPDVLEVNTVAPEEPEEPEVEIQAPEVEEVDNGAPQAPTAANGVAHTGLGGGGCTVSNDPNSRMDPLFVLLMMVSGWIFSQRRRKRKEALQTTKDNAEHGSDQL